MPSWTVDTFLAAMKRKANLPPNANAKFTDTQILAMAYEALIKQLDPMLAGLHEAYDTTSIDTAISVGEGAYLLPERAVSGTIHQVVLFYNGKPVCELPRLMPENLWPFEGQTGTPQAFALDGDVLRLVPTPSVQGQTFRVLYRRRPAQLVLTAACALVTTVNPTTLVTTGGSWSASQVVDVARAKPPLTLTVQSKTATYAAGTFTFGSGLLGKVSVGDYVCLEDTTCIVPLPERFYMLFLDVATAQLSSEWGNTADAERFMIAAEEYVSTLRTAQANRVKHQPQLAIGGGSVLQGAFGFGTRRFIG
jgi:hypothetical protein